MPGNVVYIMSCDVRVRSGLRLKSTQSRLLGREGKAPISCRRPILSCRPSSPFSLSMRRSHAVESTNNETRNASQRPNVTKEASGHQSADGRREMNSSAGSSWRNQLYRTVSRRLGVPESEEIQILDAQVKLLKNLRSKLLPQRFD